jgi:hypothetical protein
VILNVVVGVVVGSGHDGGSGCDGGGICGCLDGGGCDGGNDNVVIEATVTVVMAMVGVMVMGLVVIWWVITGVVLTVAGAMVMMMVMSLLERHLSRRSTPRFSGICCRRLRS